MIALILLIITLLMFAVACYHYVNLKFTLLTTGIMLSSIITIYAYFGHYQQATLWQKDYAEAYHLRQQFLALGTIEQIIENLELRLKKSPNDKKGWLILAKLYRIQGLDQQADIALEKVKSSD